MGLECLESCTGHGYSSLTAAQRILASWDWCKNVLFSYLAGLSDMALSVQLIFLSAADISFYTKITEWVFLDMTLFCSWVTLVWSLLILLPRSTDREEILQTSHFLQRGSSSLWVCILLARTYWCPETTSARGKHKAATLCPCNYSDCLHKSSVFVCKWPVSI